MGHRTGIALALVVILELGACTSSPPSGVPSPSGVAAEANASGSSGTPAVPTSIALSARPVITVVVGGRTLRVATADDEASWEQGLQGVTDLGNLDGMLFRFHTTGTRAFWMKDTLLPLDVAFFDDSGRFVSVTTMPLCRADPCPTYVAVAPYATALEARAGSLGFLRTGDRLDVTPAASR